MKQEQIKPINFSQLIKNSNTDEWYTPRESVEIIVPYLMWGGVQEDPMPLR